MSREAPRITALVMAAGQGRRFGDGNKLLADLDGRPLLRRAVEAALGSRVRETIVVTGHDRAAVEEALAGLPVAFTHNPEFADGLATSLRAGLAAATDADGIVVLLGDMPGVSSRIVDQLIAAFAEAPASPAVVPNARWPPGQSSPAGARAVPAPVCASGRRRRATASFRRRRRHRTDSRRRRRSGRRRRARRPRAHWRIGQAKLIFESLSGRANALAGRREIGIEHGRGRDADRRLADAAPEAAARRDECTRPSACPSAASNRSCRNSAVRRARP